MSLHVQKGGNIYTFIKPWPSLSIEYRLYRPLDNAIENLILKPRSNLCMQVRFTPKVNTAGNCNTSYLPLPQLLLPLRVLPGRTVLLGRACSNCCPGLASARC